MATAAAGVSLAPPVTARRVAAGLWSDAWFRLRRDRLTMTAIAVLALVAALSYAAPLFEQYVFNFRFDQQDLLAAYSKPTLERPEYVFGADEIGRSQAVRILYGGQVSLAVGFFAALVNMTIGVGVGLLSGFVRGRLDDFVVWFITTLNSIPGLYILLLVSALFSPSVIVLILIIGLLNWTGIANFVRGQTFSLREREFVVAARTIGASTARIMLRHILPNVLPLIIVLVAIDVGTIILIESALSYLGLGVMPPTPSWGNMLTNAAAYLSRAPWLVVPPGVMILLTVLCLYLVGDGLRDALDPRLKE